MGWTYERSPKAAFAIVTKRRMARERVERALLEDDARLALADVQALEFLLDRLDAISVAQLDPTAEDDVCPIPRRVDQPLHVSFREAPYTAYYLLNMIEMRAIMIELLRDGDPRRIFRSIDEPQGLSR